jgi:hypothetical protein
MGEVPAIDEAAARTRELVRRARFTGIGAGVLAVLGTFGLLKATGGWPLLTVAFSVALLVAARRIEGRTPPPTRGPRLATRRRAYLTIQALEYGGFAVGIVVCLVLRRPDLIGIVTIAISGAHFFALAVAIQARASYVKGALLGAIVVATLLLVPSEVRLGGRPVVAWLAFPCFAAAVVLWIDAGIAVGGARRSGRPSPLAAGP